MAERPERELVRRALGPGAAAVLLSAGLGWLVSGPGASASSALGAAVVVANFAAHGLSLAWAAGVSLAAVHVVALAGVVVRMGAIVGALVWLTGTAWFSPVAFAATAVPGTVLLLAYEARLALRGVGGGLQVPADPVAARAARRSATEGG